MSRSECTVVHSLLIETYLGNRLAGFDEVRVVIVHETLPLSVQLSYLRDKITLALEQLRNCLRRCVYLSWGCCCDSRWFRC